MGQVIENDIVVEEEQEAVPEFVAEVVEDPPRRAKPRVSANASAR